MDFLFFLGRFHVLALHLPIGIIFAVVVLEFLARGDRYRYLSNAGPYLWCAAAVTSILTAALGYLHFAEGGFDGPSGAAHRIFGTSVALAATLIWLLRVRAAKLYRTLQPIAGLVIVVLVTLTGHYGGNLTHGSTYLVEFAPEPIRRLTGLAPRRPPVTDLDLADPYLDIVRPMLYARCASCHGRDKRSGEFEMSTYASTLAGGETGAAIVPGNASVSELYRRITLARDHDAFMPAEGRTPLTEDQVAILEWWIDAGAPANTLLGAIDVPDAVGPALLREVGLAGDGGDATAQVADPSLIARLSSAGFIPRQLSQSDARLSVSPASPGLALTSEQLQSLADSAASMRELDLADAGLDDDDLTFLTSMTGLARLRLDNNALGDAAIDVIGQLESLEYLNLYGNAGVSDASIDRLASMPSLRRLYLWQTAITAAGIERLRAARPDVDVQGGSADEFARGAEEAISNAEQSCATPGACVAGD